MYVRGNHELLGEEAERLQAYIPTPNGEFYYTLAYNNAYFLINDLAFNKADAYPGFSGLSDGENYRTHQTAFVEQAVSEAEAAEIGAFDRQYYIFAVGISLDSEENRLQLRDINFDKNWLRELPCFFLPGAFDPAKLADPSLIIYHPVRQLGRALIVTNGDQTDTIRDHLELGESFEQGLRTRAFEPDGPNWTPRISGLLSADGSYKMSILKSADAEGSACARYTYEYPGVNGVGHFLHTYVRTATPSPPSRESRSGWPSPARWMRLPR